MKLSKRTLAASAALLFLLSFGGCAQKSTPQSVVATVDGTPIYRWEVDYQYSKNISYYESYQDLDTENPETIRQEIMAGCPDALNLGDREKAIAFAMDKLEKGDVLLVAGKGHETGQYINGKVLPFNDEEVVKKYL